ncbi:MAG: hypothetical protein SPE53_05875 [Prevotella sp.]|nr:hypothetical protein [Paraprevotella sp.]MDY4408639.1 hypothetical protein [Prevotella sp.]
MKKIGKVLILVCGLVAMVNTAKAQDKPEVSVSADFVNQYIWRGQDLGDISVQPTLGVAYKGLSITAWGSVGLSDNEDTKEFDLTLSYSLGNFNIGITDYWFNTPNDRYFSYAAHKTSHVFEANIGYDFGLCALQWYTNFAGNDGVNKSGDRAYSSYVELSAPFKLGGADWTAAVGAVPYATSFYGEAGGFAVTNVSLKASKDINITKTFSVPVFAGIYANPSTEKAYLAFGFTLRP